MHAAESECTRTARPESAIRTRWRDARRQQRLNRNSRLADAARVSPRTRLGGPHSRDVRGSCRLCKRHGRPRSRISPASLWRTPPRYVNTRWGHLAIRDSEGEPIRTRGTSPRREHHRSRLWFNICSHLFPFKLGRHACVPNSPMRDR